MFEDRDWEVIPLECDEVAVPDTLWHKVIDGDASAVEQLKKLLDGLEIYMHLLSVDQKSYTVVTIRELNEAGIVKFIRLDCGLDG